MPRQLPTFLSAGEREAIRQIVYDVEGEIDDQMTRRGSYRYLCKVAGVPVLAHRPVGLVLRRAPTEEKETVVSEVWLFVFVGAVVGVLWWRARN